jgi:hypothetical protein
LPTCVRMRYDAILRTGKPTSSIPFSDELTARMV